MFQGDPPVRLPDVVLRPYQQEAMARILACKDRGMDRVIVVMPTGTGKTTLFSALIGEFDRSYDKRSLVLAHRRELLDQAAGRIRQQNGLVVETESGKQRANAEGRVVVASVQSVGRPGSNRLDGFDAGCLIIDEAHHAAADSYQRVMDRLGCYEGRCFTVGVTATPHRMDNKALHGHDEAIFQEVAFSYTLREAILDGWLADLRGYRVATDVDLSKVRKVHGDYSSKQLQDAVNTEERNRVAFDNWSNIARERRTIVFCTGVEHAEDVAELFRQNGISAEAVNGAMKPDVREGIMRRFASGCTQVLTNVDIATEGFDIPDASCVLMLRPTQSWALYTQMIGRGLRVLPNTIDGIPDASARRKAVRGSRKPDCIVIDIVDTGTAAPRPKPEKDNEERPSLTAMVGLPPELDLEGRTAVEALEQWERLSPEMRALMFRRPTRYGDLSTTLTAVDLLAELSVPEEMAGFSRLAWMKMGDGQYLLACGSSAHEANRIAQLECDTLGRWRLTLSSSRLPPEGVHVECGDELLAAFARADGLVKETWPFIGGLVSASGKWRREPMTDRQRQELLHLGVDHAVVEMVENAGKAWTLIQMKRRPVVGTQA